MKQLFLHILVLQLITVSSETCSKVKCSIDDPATFGSNVSILCENNGSMCEDRTWMGGHNFKSLDHLLHNGIPHVSLGNSTKYTEKVVSCQDIQLVISNFSEKDLNQQIVFTVGFHQCRFNVSFGSTNFEYHPKDGEIKTKINLSSTSLSLAIKMEKVYPVPNCSIILGDEHLENLAEMHINRTGNMYTVHVHTFVEYSSKKGECPIMAKVICQIGETVIMVISSNFTNCASKYILHVFPWDIFAIQVSCILVMIFCILLVMWSLRRNWTNIVKTCKDLSKRKPEQWRRPVLAVLSASVSVTLSVQTEVMSIKQMLQLDMGEKQDIVTPVSLCLSTMVLTPISLCFMSNPETVSIRKGFRKAVDNFMKRVLKWKSCLIRCIPKYEPNIVGTRHSGCRTEVECTIGSKPAVFGQPLSILCTNTNTSICVKNESRVWMGGQNLDLLVLEGIPKRGTARYSEKVQSCSEFELLISNLSESDLDHNYGCTVGFFDCRLKLSLTEGDFEYHPEELDIHKNFSISVHDLFVSVNISKVYPVPTCSVLFGIQKLDEFINQSATRIGNFFSTYFDFQFKLPQDQCPIKINISCLVGSTLIPILTSEIANCSENRDLITFIQHSLTVPIFCSILTCMYLVLLTLSLCRNRKKIYTTCNALSGRSLLERRRPILAVLLTLGSIYLAGHTEYISFKQFVQDSDDVENNTVEPIGFCVSSMLLMQVSLCFISNPDTISIREGFKNSTKRFVKKVKREKKHKDNPTEKRRLNEISVADQSKDECHQYTDDAIGNQS